MVAWDWPRPYKEGDPETVDTADGPGCGRVIPAGQSVSPKGASDVSTESGQDYLIIPRLAAYSDSLSLMYPTSAASSAAFSM